MSMEDEDYPNQVVLNREDDPYIPGGHSFSICDRSGKIIDDKKWFRVEFGHIHLEIRNLSLRSHLVPKTEEDGVEKDSVKFETITGRGLFVGGTSQPIFGGRTTTISFFGNDNEHTGVDVTIRESDKGDYFLVGGLKRTLDATLRIDESFYVEFYLTPDTFNSFRDSLVKNNPDRVNVEMCLKGHPSFYTYYSSGLGSDLTRIRLWDTWDDKIIVNKNDFDESFLKTVFDTDPRGRDFSFSLLNQFGNDTVETDSEHEIDHHDVDPVQTMFSCVQEYHKLTLNQLKKIYTGILILVGVSGLILMKLL